MKLFAVMNLSEPKIRPLPSARKASRSIFCEASALTMTVISPGLDAPPMAWCVIGPDVSLSKGVEVILATTSGSVLLVTHEQVKDLVRCFTQ